jgi:hypothetical protein
VTGAPLTDERRDRVNNTIDIRAWALMQFA